MHSLRPRQFPVRDGLALRVFLGGVLFCSFGGTLDLAAEPELQTVLLEFSASWCGPCRQMAPVVEELRRTGYPVRQVDIEREPALARRFRITAVPTFVMVVNGREVDRIVGPATIDQLKLLCRLAPQRPVTSPGEALATNSPTTRQDHSTPTPAIAGAVRSSAPQPSPLPPFDGRCRFASPTEDDLIAATVRIRINDPGGRSTGSGTIIDARGGEALIVTCGHLFRESQGKLPVYVDLFGPRPARDLPAQLIYYDDKLDIGFLSIRLSQPVVVARVAPPGYPLAVGDSVFSVGCGEGRPPEVWRGKVTALGKYLGPGNIEASGAPVVGRSGGGLFSSEGFLIGVCNAADPPLNEGIYLALSEIHRSLDHLNLAVVYRPDGVGVRPGDAPSRAEIAQTSAIQSLPGQHSASELPEGSTSCPPGVTEDSAAIGSGGPQPPVPTGTASPGATSPEALTLAAGLPLPVPPRSPKGEGPVSGSSAPSAHAPELPVADGRPVGSPLEPSQTRVSPVNLPAGLPRAQAAAETALSPEERAAWEEINRRRAAGYEIVCVVRPMDQPHAPSEVIVLRHMSPQFFALLRSEGVKTLVPSDAPQAPSASGDLAALQNPRGAVHADTPLVPISGRNIRPGATYGAERDIGGPAQGRPASSQGAASVALPAAVMALPPPRTQ